MPIFEVKVEDTVFLTFHIEAESQIEAGLIAQELDNEKAFDVDVDRDVGTISYYSE